MVAESEPVSVLEYPLTVYAAHALMHFPKLAHIP
jgi:hypothetical protein